MLFAACKIHSSQNSHIQLSQISSTKSTQNCQFSFLRVPFWRLSSEFSRTVAPLDGTPALTPVFPYPWCQPTHAPFPSLYICLATHCVSLCTFFQILFCCSSIGTMHGLRYPFVDERECHCVFVLDQWIPTAMSSLPVEELDLACVVGQFVLS